MCIARSPRRGSARRVEADPLEGSGSPTEEGGLRSFEGMFPLQSGHRDAAWAADGTVGGPCRTPSGSSFSPPGSRGFPGLDGGNSPRLCSRSLSGIDEAPEAKAGWGRKGTGRGGSPRPRFLRVRRDSSCRDRIQPRTRAGERRAFSSRIAPRAGTHAGRKTLATDSVSRSRQDRPAADPGRWQRGARSTHPSNALRCRNPHRRPSRGTPRGLPRFATPGGHRGLESHGCRPRLHTSRRHRRSRRGGHKSVAPGTPSATPTTVRSGPRPPSKPGPRGLGRAGG